MIVYHIHNHTDAGLMQRLNHFLHFPDTYLPVERIGCIGSLRHIVLHRVISPVKRFRIIFRHTAKIENRKQMHMRNAKRFQVIEPRRMNPVAVQRRAFFRKRQKLSTVFIRNTAMRITRKIFHMKLIHTTILRPDFRSFILLPACRIRLCKIHHHAPLRINTGSHAVRICRIKDTIRVQDMIRIIRSIPGSLHCTAPDTLFAACHRKRSYFSVPVLPAAAAGKQLQRNLHRCRRPELPFCHKLFILFRHLPVFIAFPALFYRNTEVIPFIRKVFHKFFRFKKAFPLRRRSFHHRIHLLSLHFFVNPQNLSDTPRLRIAALRHHRRRTIINLRQMKQASFLHPARKTVQSAAHFLFSLLREIVQHRTEIRPKRKSPDCPLMICPVTLRLASADPWMKCRILHLQ